MPAREINFDGLVGPTHHYAGLSPGNLASLRHAGDVANPRAAALQGLEKMRFVADLGVGQAVLPPQPRPDLGLLRRLGFSGSDRAVLAHARRTAPDLLSAACSASSMWAANAATVAPSSDADDGRVHLVPANLVSMLHRSIEAEPTARLLSRIFAERRYFEVHDPLPASDLVTDEGVGISAADLPFIFRPFFRADRSRTRATGGLGLGLALAKRIADAHGGTIEIDSTPGKGTHATVRVPFGRAKQNPLADV